MSPVIHNPAHDRGFTLVELMVSLVLGLILTGGVVALFIQSRQSFAIDENVARMQDHARFAMSELARDIRMASYVTEPLVPGGVLLDATTLPASGGCGPGTDDWAFRLTDADGDMDTVTGLDNASAGTAAGAFSCIVASDVWSRTVGGATFNSDVIAIKRAGGAIVPDTSLEQGRYYIESNGTIALLFREPTAVVVGGPADHWEYRPRIYYLRNYGNTVGDGIPTLCRKVLSGAAMVDECIAQGIEDLQFEYGIDPDEDGSANTYMAAPTPEQLQEVVSVRITLLARTAQADNAYQDDRTYAIGNSGAYAPNDRFHRRVYSETVTIHNLRNLQRLGI